MVTNCIMKPFDVDLAKKIEGGDIEGFIFTRDQHEARIVEWSMKGATIRPILVAVERHTGREAFYDVDINGMVYAPEENDYDLLLYVPDWMDASDGDIIYGASYKDGVWCKWVSVLKGDIGYIKGEPYFRSYVELELEGDNIGEMRFDTQSCQVDYASLGSDLERKFWRGLLMQELGKSSHKQSDQILKIITDKSVIKTDIKSSAMTYDENGCIYYQEQEQ